MQDYFEVHKPSLQSTNIFVSPSGDCSVRARILKCGVQLFGVGQGLKYLHQQDVVHGDLRSVCRFTTGAPFAAHYRGRPTFSSMNQETLASLTLGFRHSSKRRQVQQREAKRP